jgi:hypothetical protein
LASQLHALCGSPALALRAHPLSRLGSQFLAAFTVSHDILYRRRRRRQSCTPLPTPQVTALPCGGDDSGDGEGEDGADRVPYPHMLPAHYTAIARLALRAKRHLGPALDILDMDSYISRCEGRRFGLHVEPRPGWALSPAVFRQRVQLCLPGKDFAGLAALLQERGVAAAAPSPAGGALASWLRGEPVQPEAVLAATLTARVEYRQRLRQQALSVADGSVAGGQGAPGSSSNGSGSPSQADEDGPARGGGIRGAAAPRQTRRAAAAAAEAAAALGGVEGAWRFVALGV